VNRSPRHPCVILTGILGTAAALSCNNNDVTQPRLTLTHLTVGMALTDQVARGAAKVYAAGVLPVFGDFNQAAAGQAGNNPAHGRRLNLLGGSEFTQCFRASEH